MFFYPNKQQFLCFYCGYLVNFIILKTLRNIVTHNDVIITIGEILLSVVLILIIEHNSILVDKYLVYKKGVQTIKIVRLPFSYYTSPILLF